MATQSLRQGLVWRLATLMLMFSVVASFVVYRLALRFGSEAYDEWLLDTARSMTQLVEPAGGHFKMDVPASTLRAVIYDDHDRVLYRINDDAERFVAGDAQLHMHSLDKGQAVRYDDIVVDGQPMRAVEIVHNPASGGGSVFIMVAETLHKRHRLASRVLGTVMMLSGIFSLLTVLLARDAVTRGLAPLKQLAEVVRLRRHDDLTPLPDTRVAQELKTFTDAINGLLRQLDEAVAAQRRFIADAAHQLRTPLAALRAELEYAMREPDRTRQQEALARLDRALDRLTRVTNQLLTLARAEPGAVAASGFAEMDLREVVHRTAMRLLPGFIEAGIELAFEGEQALPVKGDVLLLEEVTNNLLDNALRYAGPGSLVTVKVYAQHGRVTLQVEDNGPGVPEAERPRLTQRFHRVDGRPGGSGLGLAIVEEITSLHGGVLHIEAVEPSGLRVRVELPLNPSPSR